MKKNVLTFTIVHDESVALAFIDPSNFPVQDSRVLGHVDRVS